MYVEISCTVKISLEGNCHIPCSQYRSAFWDREKYCLKGLKIVEVQVEKNGVLKKIRRQL